jgi:hypothetical protein
MPNQHVKQVLSDRIQILEVLESLLALAPGYSVHTKTLGEFGVSTNSADDVRAHLSYISDSGVAQIVVPSITRWDFWDKPVRIRDINLVKLHDMQRTTEREIRRMSPRKLYSRIPVELLWVKLRGLFSTTFRMTVAVSMFIAAAVAVVTFLVHSYQQLSHDHGHRSAATSTKP